MDADVSRRTDQNALHSDYKEVSSLAKYPFEPYHPGKKLRCCVTGAGGFIASHLAKRLKAEGHYVVACDWKRNEHFSVRGGRRGAAQLDRRGGTAKFVLLLLWWWIVVLPPRARQQPATEPGSAAWMRGGAAPTTAPRHCQAAGKLCGGVVSCVCSCKLNERAAVRGAVAGTLLSL